MEADAEGCASERDVIVIDDSGDDHESSGLSNYSPRQARPVCSSDAISIGSSDDGTSDFQLQLELSQWIYDSAPTCSWCSSTIPQFTDWGGRLLALTDLRFVKSVAIAQLLEELNDALKGLDDEVAVARKAASDAEAERLQIVRELFTASPYQQGTHHRTAKACWEYYEHALGSFAVARVERLRAEGTRHQQRRDDLKAQRHEVASLRTSLETERAAMLAGWEAKPTQELEEATQTLSDLATAIVNDLSAYHTAFFRLWRSGDEQQQDALVAEATAFWREMRFWLPAWVTTVVAQELQRLSQELTPPTAAQSALAPAIAALTARERLSSHTQRSY